MDARSDQPGVRMLDPAVAAVSAFIRGDRATELTRCLVMRRFLAHPLRAVRVLTVIRRLPTVVVPTTDDPEGRALNAVLKAARPGGRRRFGVSYLAIPEADYLVGRHRQAVRTNVRRATREGCEVIDLPPGPVRQQRFDEVLVHEHDAEAREFWLRIAAEEVDRRCFAVVAADGVTLAVAAVTVNGAWSHQTLFIRNPTRPDASPARYLLQSAVISRLASRGVCHLLTDSSILIPEGLRYFQHLLGFVPVNLHIVEADTSSSSGIDFGRRRPDP